MNLPKLGRAALVVVITAGAFAATITAAGATNGGSGPIYYDTVGNFTLASTCNFTFTTPPAGVNSRPGDVMFTFQGDATATGAVAAATNVQCDFTVNLDSGSSSTTSATGTDPGNHAATIPATVTANTSQIRSVTVCVQPAVSALNGGPAYQFGARHCRTV
ncbi:MAG: hypothetical protein ACRD2W_17095 [Acidimicrobiales bacterium]